MTVIMPFGRAVVRQTLPRSNHLLTRLAPSNPLLRVSCTEYGHSKDSQSCYRHILNKHAVLSVRSYATEAAAKSAAKPKAHTGRTTAKRSTTKAKSTTTAEKPAKKPVRKTKKTAKAKPKSKPKSKSKPKPRVKKELSKHAINQARIAKTKDLKAKALLTEPKQLPTSAWSVYFSANIGGTKSIAEGAEKTKETARNFRVIPAEEREHLNHTANQNQKTNENEYKKWVSQYTPAEIKEANNARKLLSQQKNAQEGKKKTNLHLIKDDRLVKQQRNAYSFFLVDRWASGDFKHMALAESSRLIAKEWKELSTSDKKPFQDQADADLNRYLEEYKTVYGKDSPASKPRKST